MNSPRFMIKHLKEFIDTSRYLVFNSFGSKEQDISIDINPQDKEELDQILSYSESISVCKNFIKKQRNKITAETRYIIDEKSYFAMISALNDRLVSNLLNSLVNKGLIETAYDEKANDFIFWCAKNDKEQKKPETN